MSTALPRSATLRLLAPALLLAVVVAACGSDGDTAGPDGPSTTGNIPTGGVVDAERAVDALDTNGDGSVTIGVATPGPADDGGYHQALVETVEAISAAHGFSDPVVIDRIGVDDAARELETLARSDVDLIAVGASSIADPLPDLAAEYADVYWYCNCGTGLPGSDLYSQSTDDAAGISYTAGVATGLLLEASGGDTVSFLGCCDLPFESESFGAFELGLHSVDGSMRAVYSATGGFDDAEAAVAAFDAALADGADAVYPFLGGAHRAVVERANEAGVITLSAGDSRACDRTDLDYGIAVRYDAGDYLDAVFVDLLDGSFPEGSTRVFHVGVDPEPGAAICDPTAEQTETLDTAYALVASEGLADEFAALAAPGGEQAGGEEAAGGNVEGAGGSG